jgi:hypothetical protein
MPERGEVEALKASFGGVVSASTVLLDLRGRIEALEPCREVDEALLQDLARAAAGHAVASAALRALVESLMRRRGAPPG